MDTLLVGLITPSASVITNVRTMVWEVHPLQSCAVLSRDEQVNDDIRGFTLQETTEKGEMNISPLQSHNPSLTNQGLSSDFS